MNCDETHYSDSAYDETLYTLRETSMRKLCPFVILYLFTMVKLCNIHDRLKEYFILFFSFKYLV
jgi:hypothetical protein